MKALYIGTCHLISSGHLTIGESNPIEEITGKCLYKNGDYSIYTHIKGKAYYFLWKNVIVGEFTGINKELADMLVSGEKPTEFPQKYNYEKALDEINEAPMWANKYGFKIR